MDTLNDIIDMDKTFDDLLFSNWNHQTFGEVVQSPSRTNSNADTDSDSGIGYPSSSNSPMANTYQHHQQNEHNINTTLTDNTVDSELSQLNDFLLYNQIDNEPLSYQVCKSKTASGLEIFLLRTMDLKNGAQNCFPRVFDRSDTIL
jgi:hypothetical protein